MRPLCQGGCSSPTRPANRARHLDRQLRLLAALGSGKARPAQLPHHDHVIGELTLEPRGGDEQFRTFSLLRRKSVQYESWASAVRLSQPFGALAGTGYRAGYRSVSG
jgi:hypothetical protein